MSAARLAPLALALWAALQGAALAAETPDAAERRYYQRGQAEAEAARRRAAGMGAQVQTVSEPARLHHVQLLYYQTQAAAELAVGKLRRLGAESYVVQPRERFGWAISAGSFTARASAERRAAELRAQGFANLRISELDGRLVAYRVLSTGKRLAGKPQPAAPPRPPQAPAPAPKAAEAEEFTFTEAPAGSAEPETLTFGAVADAAAEAPPQRFEAALEELRLELGAPVDGANASTGLALLRAIPSLRYKPNPDFSIEAAVQLDAVRQAGSPAYAELDADYEEVFLRYRTASTRWTLGAQTVLWGRMDELSPTNLYLRQDLTRYTLEDVTERYQAQAALRFEYFAGEHKFEALGLPHFEPSELPDADSVWHPLDRARGRLQGTPWDPLLAALVRLGTFEEDPAGDDEGRFGGGLRYSYSGQGLDFGLTALRVQPTTPYPVLNPAVRNALFLGLPPALAVRLSAEPTFQAAYPRTGLAGADLAFTALDATWRAELVYTSDNPVTTPALDRDTVPAWAWAAGVELYPGDGNNRLTLQLNGRRLRPGSAIAGAESSYSFSGELENGYAQDRWRLRTRWLASWSEGERDWYLNPELAFGGWEPQELYLGLHLFEGDAAMASGYHRDHDLLLLGWRSRF